MVQKRFEFKLSYSELVKIGSVVVAIAGAFFALKGDLQTSRAIQQMDHAQILLSAAYINNINAKLADVDKNVLSTNLELQALTTVLYEKKIVRTPTVAKTTSGPSGPDVALAVEDEANEERHKSLGKKIIAAPVFVGKKIAQAGKVVVKAL